MSAYCQRISARWCDLSCDVVSVEACSAEHNASFGLLREKEKKKRFNGLPTAGFQFKPLSADDQTAGRIVTEAGVTLSVEDDF